MRMLIPLTVALILPGALSAAAAPDQKAERAAKEQAELAKALKGRVQSGKPQSCINMRDIRSTKVVGRSTIIYEMPGKLAYRNDFGGSCGWLNDRYTLITRTPTNRLCRGDIARVADLVTGFENGSCVYGDFVPYRPG